MVWEWVYANNYWERSAYVSNSTNFMNVNTNGNPSNNNNASNTNGVLCGFSRSEVARPSAASRPYMGEKRIFKDRKKEITAVWRKPINKLAHITGDAWARRLS